MKLIDTKIKERSPFVGVFVKKDDRQEFEIFFNIWGFSNREDTVSSLDELYSVGTFALVSNILVAGDMGILSMALSGHHRIRLLSPLDPFPILPKKINVRRFRSLNKVVVIFAK